MSKTPPIARVRSTPPPAAPKPPAAPAPHEPAPPTDIPAEAILAAFDSWVGNIVQKYRVPAARIRALVHDDTDPLMDD